MRRRIIALIAAASLALSAIAVAGLTAPDAALGASPTPSAPMSMRLEAARHTAYLLNSRGTITGSKAATLIDATAVQANGRSSIGTRGVFLRMSSGPLSGYWIRESILAHVIGSTGERAFNPHRSISLPTGKVVAHKFDASWELIGAPVLTVTDPSSTTASGSAVINGLLHYRIVSGPFADAWLPSGGDHAARALPCRTGPKAGGGAAVWSRMTSAGPEVALTFDMGGRTDPALAIVKRLIFNGVCTTLFPTGDAAETAEGEAALEFADSFPAIFELGNHTQNHCDLVRGGGGGSCPSGHASSGFVKSELSSTETTVRAITGMSTTPYWRPPYGAHDQAIRIAARDAGYTKTVMWHIDTIDWKEPPPTATGPTALAISDKVVNGALNGTIVLMHLGGWETYDALPSMIAGLRGRGFATTSVSDLADGS